MGRPEARIEQLRKLMAHADISTTAVYLLRAEPDRRRPRDSASRARRPLQTRNVAATEPGRASISPSPAVRSARSGTATDPGGLTPASGALLATAQAPLWIALMLLLVATALGVRARHWARLATRSRVGARVDDTNLSRSPIRVIMWPTHSAVALPARLCRGAQRSSGGRSLTRKAPRQQGFL